MHTRRQLLAAGLLVAALLMAPVGAGRPAAPVQAGAPFSHAEAAALEPIFLPLVISQVDAPDLSVSAVQVVQGVTMSPDYTALVAGRPALVRVFVTVTASRPGGGVNNVTARLTHYRDGVAQGELFAGPMALAAGNATQADLTQTLNFNLPAAWTGEDSAYVVELDPEGLVLESDEANNRYPATGQQPYHFASAPELEVVIVPVEYRRPGGTPTTPPLDDLSYLTWMPAKVLPVAQIHYSVRPVPLEFTGDLRTATGWVELLQAVDAVRAAEDPTWNKVYYGLVDTIASGDCGWACYTGLGYVNGPGYAVYKTSVGFAGIVGARNEASVTFTHEMGHNFGRRHAPCAGPSNVDTNYPYAGAAIGQWGYDLDTGALISPGTKDYMSYCGPTWTSDYTYFGIAQAWSWFDAPRSAATATDGDRLVFSGYRAADGTWRVEPVFAGEAPLGRSEAAVRYRLELLDRSGLVLESVPFELTELALDAATHDAPSAPAGFRVAAGAPAGLAGFRIYDGEALVYERLAEGSAPSLAGATASSGTNGDLRWRLTGPSAVAHYRVRFSPDGGRTWTLLTVDSVSPRVEVPFKLLAGASAPQLEVQVSDGVRSDGQRYSLARP